MTRNVMDTKDWLALDEAGRLLHGFVYKDRYEASCEFMGVENPTPWEDLTNEQRMGVKKECIRYQQEMDAFGATIRGDAGNS